MKKYYYFYMKMIIKNRKRSFFIHLTAHLCYDLVIVACLSVKEWHIKMKVLYLVFTDLKIFKYGKT